MSKKTVKFKKQLGQATSNGRDANTAKALLTPNATVIGDGTSKRGGKCGSKGGVASLPRKKPAIKV